MTRTGLFSTLTLCAIVASVAAMIGGAAEDSKPKAKIGEAAPAFTLEDSNGKTHSLSDYMGKIIVLEWINPQCPVCVRVYKSGIIEDTIEKLKSLDADLVYLAINSTNSDKNKGPEENLAFLKEHKIDIPALVDEDGTVGHLYGARTTPHVFVIDAEGVLRYQGALDDDGSGSKAKKGETVTNYAVNALQQIKAGETVAPDSTQSYGCNVKYKDDGMDTGKPRGRSKN